MRLLQGGIFRGNDSFVNLQLFQILSSRDVKMRYTVLMKSRSRMAGFSTLEFFVVLSIVILMSGLLMAVFHDPKKEARDTRRISDVKDFARALELYSSDNKSYPAAAALTTITGNDSITTLLTGSGALDKPVVDPLMPTYEYRYQTNMNASNYHIEFCLETSNFEGYAIGCGNVYTP